MLASRAVVWANRDDRNLGSGFAENGPFLELKEDSAVGNKTSFYAIADAICKTGSPW
jgi:hypothetical protein